MNQRSSASARVFAVTALVVAVIVVIVAIASSLGGGSKSSSDQKHGGKSAAHKVHTEPVPATYEVKSGDTLISIAHHTGVPVKRIEELNPEVDPQILVAGQRLKLR